MAFVHFRRTYVRDLEGGEKQTYPSGWRGEVDDSVADAARSAGYLRDSTSASVAISAATGGGEIDETMSRAELDKVATAAGLVPGEYGNKADLIAAIKSA